MNTINRNGIDVSVTINGRPTRAYFHEGKYFIESRDGTEYAIEIKNNNCYRVEAVVAVDGLSVITGKPASANDVGYIVNGYDRVVVKGFRKDLNEVGAFKFTKKEKSYAAGKGQEDNVGVIAVAVHKEKHQPVNWAVNTDKYKFNDWTPTLDNWDIKAHTTTDSIKICDPFGVSPAGTCNLGAHHSTGLFRQYTNTSYSTDKSITNNAQNVSFDHGTTWGKKIEDKVVNVEFIRDYLLVTTEVYYNSKENLEAMGIKLIQEKQVNFPRGFPVDFASPPPGWKG